MLKILVSISITLFMSHAALAASGGLNPTVAQQFLQSLVNTYDGTGHIHTVSGPTTDSTSIRTVPK